MNLLWTDWEKINGDWYCRECKHTAQGQARRETQLQEQELQRLQVERENAPGRLLGDLINGSQDGIHEFPFEYVKQITHDFHDENLIGKGGFGNVFIGSDETFPLERKVAVKRLNMQSLGDVVNARRRQNRSFEQEVKILSSLCHPNIVKLYGYVNTYDNDNSNNESSGIDAPEICLIFEYGQLDSVANNLLSDDKAIEFSWRR